MENIEFRSNAQSSGAENNKTVKSNAKSSGAEIGFRSSGSSEVHRVCKQGVLIGEADGDTEAVECVNTATEIQNKNAQIWVFTLTWLMERQRIIQQRKYRAECGDEEAGIVLRTPRRELTHIR